MDSPNDDARNEAAGLLRTFGTKPEAMVDQAVADLKNADSGYTRNACDYLAKTPVNEARRAEVSKALETPLADGTNGETRKAAAVALKIWGTKDNVPALIAEMDNKNDPFHGSPQACMEALGKLKDERGAAAVAAHLADFGFGRDKVVQALRDMGPVAEKAVAAYVTHPDQGVRAEAEQVVEVLRHQGRRAIDAAVADLDATDANQRKTAVEYLATQPVDDAHQKQVARAWTGCSTTPTRSARCARRRPRPRWCGATRTACRPWSRACRRRTATSGGSAWRRWAGIKDEKAVVPLILQTAKGKPHVAGRPAGLDPDGASCGNGPG